MNTFALAFSTQAEAEEFFGVLSYARLPVRFQETRAAHGYADDGRKIVTFARRNLAQEAGCVAYTFVEQPVR